MTLISSVALRYGKHPSKATKEALRPYIESGVKFVHLPTYAPEYNPIEHVWGAAKAHIANVQYEKLEDLCDTFEGYIKGRTFDYKF